MTAVIVLVVVVVGAAGALWVLRLRAVERERRRLATLATVAAQLEAARRALPQRAREPEPTPAAPLRPPVRRGRAALVDGVTEAVAGARTNGERLALAVIESPDSNADALARDVAAVTGDRAYTVGPRSVVLVVRAAGRADALGLLARIEAACSATGRAVELEPGEDAVELLARAWGLSPKGD